MVTCFTKDNIMKQTDGLFHQVFDGNIQTLKMSTGLLTLERLKWQDTPEIFGVIVMPNLHGNVLSDVAHKLLVR